MRLAHFNLYFLVAALLCSTGCQTDQSKKAEAGKKEKDKDKIASTLRLHLEANLDGTERTRMVPVFRADPVMVGIITQPFLTEADVEQAAVIDVEGGFQLQIQFRDGHGARLLEMTTTSFKGQRIAVFSQFGEARWIGAPVITRRIPDGIFRFTPDLSLEEANRLVLGLNNVARELKKKNKF